MDEEPVQMFFENGGRWGWQCFLCGEEVTGLLLPTLAELGRDSHECDWLS